MLKKTVAAIHEQLDGGEARYWANDHGPTLNGALHDSARSAAVVGVITNYIGLVDEQDGGMILFGPAEQVNAIAEKLNRLDAIERIASC